MLLRSHLFVAPLVIGLALFSTPCRISGQKPDLAQLPQAQSAATLLDAPIAHPAALADDLAQQITPAQAPAPDPSSQAQAAPEKSQRDKAEDQMKEQEHQRVAGVMATFNTTRDRNAAPLSPRQKFRLFFRGAIDPWPFMLAGITAGVDQANDSPHEWGQGLKGYAKRYGSNFSSTFIGNFFGNALLPVVLHEDPRYFQMGTGSTAKRFFWAVSSAVWSRRDNGKWGPNYANVGGNLIGAAIARTYLPPSQRNVASTITDGLTVSAEGIIGSEVIEFWPDLARHMKRKHDEKMARRAAQSAVKDTAQPAPKN